jgi:hypothetical protein
VSRGGDRFGEFAEWHVWATSLDELTLRLGRGEEAAILHVAHSKDRKRPLFKVGPFAFSFPQDRPLDTRLRKNAVRDLTRYLNAWLMARRRRA